MVKSRFLRQIVKSYSIVLIIITSIFTLVLYCFVEARIQNSTIQYQNELTEKTTRQIDDFLGRMDDVANRVTSDTDTVVLFSKLNNENHINNYFKENVVKAIDIGSKLKTINGSTDPVWRINVYNQCGDFISSGAITEGYDEIKKTLNTMNIGDTMMNLKYSSRIVLPPNKDRWSNYFKSQYISIFRPVMNKYGKDVYAVVEVQEDISKLESLIQSGVNNMQVRIYDKDERLIISQGEIPDINKGLQTTSKSEISGWRVEIISINQGKSFYGIIGIFILTYLLFIMFIFLITYLIASKITRPLQELRLAVKRVSPTNISIKTNKGVIDEIKELSDAFSDVLIRIGDAAIQEKKAYLLAMQAQMNPHFVFNILSVISVAGMEVGSDKIVDMCQQISDILRYVASYESSVVHFRDEITHTQNYLNLMKARYEDCFSYEIIVDDRINDIMIPKLILQPLVENCFKDAFSEVEPPWKINIVLGIEEDFWYIKVEDNGIGFSESKIKDVDLKIERFRKGINENYKELKIGGLGLASTITRLRLSCDTDVEYNIENLCGKGTRIIIKSKINKLKY
ncbi:histidine kinase [Clostridium sp. SHJSY1]|uniref:sensor histidine kinase n=1 Tax=Clostridium sp. SHJSY1 TaxID=2942483 RepID=UPI002874BA56|nr:histidine kinase [Clostridium sp. SHJSY1]MDS0527041.1 histidine kinase [Clostridium sp. SHJSY1]